MPSGQHGYDRHIKCEDSYCYIYIIYIHEYEWIVQCFSPEYLLGMR